MTLAQKKLLMIVCGPESEVTTEHVEYLLKAAKQKNANAAALTADIGITSEAQRAIEESSVSIIDESTVTSKASTQTVSSLNEPLKSSTANTVRSPAASEKSQEEMSKSEINNKYFQFTYLSFLFGLSL